MGQPSTIYKPGRLNYVWNYLGKTLKEFAAALSPYLSSGGGTVDAEGNLIIANSSNDTVSVANGATHQVPDFSGMVIVNDHFDGGVELWICGGGDCVLVNHTTAAPGGNTFEQSSNNGYEWTNVDNLTGPFTFTVIKTRNEA